jgi:glycosyltransferase involved in cell wall biosynthesis
LYCFNQTGEGLGAAWNQGIDLAQGQLIAFLDSDDLWSPQKLRLQVNNLQQQDQVDYLISHFRFFLEQGCLIPIGFKPQLLDQNQVGRIPGTLLVHREMFDKIGKFNANLKIASDVEWFSRCKNQKLISAILKEVVLFKRVHETNLSSQAQCNNQELLKILRASVVCQRGSSAD